jgi:hypothetical protein
LRQVGCRRPRDCRAAHTHRKTRCCQNRTQGAERNGSTGAKTSEGTWDTAQDGIQGDTDRDVDVDAAHQASCISPLLTTTIFTTLILTTIILTTMRSHSSSCRAGGCAWTSRTPTGSMLTSWDQGDPRAKREVKHFNTRAASTACREEPPRRACPLLYSYRGDIFKESACAQTGRTGTSRISCAARSALEQI